MRAQSRGSPIRAAFARIGVEEGGGDDSPGRSVAESWVDSPYCPRAGFSRRHMGAAQEPGAKEEGPVRINCQEWPLKLTFSPENIQSFRNCPIAGCSTRTGVPDERRICARWGGCAGFE